MVAIAIWARGARDPLGHRRTEPPPPIRGGPRPAGWSGLGLGTGLPPPPREPTTSPPPSGSRTGQVLRESLSEGLGPPGLHDQVDPGPVAQPEM